MPRYRREAMTPEFGSPRTAIVTGGARRIGAAFVRALAADGWTMLIHCHESLEEGEAVAAELPGARAVQADLAAADCAETILAALEGMPPPGLLVNSASRFDLDQFDDFTVEGWDRHFLPNLRGPALLTRAFARHVPADANALVVNVLDAKLSQPNPDFFTYTMSKIWRCAGVNELLATGAASRAAASGSMRLRTVGHAGLGPAERARISTRSTASIALERGVEVGEIVAALRFLVQVPTYHGADDHPRRRPALSWACRATSNSSEL
jgi:NAD(P)-dependent dehydrogenase (short-subunit alcohol dehydrogenase family)